MNYTALLIGLGIIMTLLFLVAWLGMKGMEADKHEASIPPRTPPGVENIKRRVIG